MDEHEPDILPRGRSNRESFNPMPMLNPDWSEPQSIRVREKREFKIRLASTNGQRAAASLLINKMYSWRGYGSSFSVDDCPNQLTLIACSEGCVAATITLGFDSSVGLLADDLFKAEIDPLRWQGRKVCEFTKLAVDRNVHCKRVLAALFHIAFIHARRIRRFTDLFIEVNPRHVGFYRSMLGFRQFTEARMNRRVNAPAVLLGVELDYIHRQILEYGGRIDLAAVEKSLYPYGFSPEEEEGITRRLMVSETPAIPGHSLPSGTANRWSY